MKKILPLFFLFVLSFSNTTYGGFLKKLYGTSRTMNSVNLGAAVYHFLSPRSQIFFPFIDYTSKDSLTINAFENSYNRFGASIGIKRNWFTHEFNNGIDLQSGYAIGVTYGYCIMSLGCYHHSLPFIPSFLLFSQIYFSKHIGFYGYLAGSAVSSGLSIRW